MSVPPGIYKLTPSHTALENGVLITQVKSFVPYLLCIWYIINTRIFFYKEPTSRPSSKSSLFLDLKSANCSTKSSLIVP